MQATKISKTRLAQQRAQPTQLPIYKISGKFYFRDARLGEYRNIRNMHDSMLIDSVNLDQIQTPTTKDAKKVYGNA
jgi:hypothetical protein